MPTRHSVTSITLFPLDTKTGESQTHLIGSNDEQLNDMENGTGSTFGAAFSYPPDRKTRVSRLTLEQQIAAGEQQLDELENARLAAPSVSSHSNSEATTDPSEILALRQLVQDMRAEMEMLRSADPPESRFIMGVEADDEPPPEYQAESQGTHEMAPQEDLVNSY